MKRFEDIKKGDKLYFFNKSTQKTFTVYVDDVKYNKDTDYIEVVFSDENVRQQIIYIKPSGKKRSSIAIGDKLLLSTTPLN